MKHKISLKKKIVFSLIAVVLFLFLSCIGIFVVGELFFAFKGLPGNYLGCYDLDRRFGLVHKPFTKLKYTAEGYSCDRFNNKGLRDVDHEYVKDKNTKRVLILGDSFVEALQVPLEKTFVRLLEKQLNAGAKSNIKWEIINGGVQGYGTCQEYLYLKYEGIKYSPDIVILCFFANDLAATSFEIQEMFLHNRAAVQRPYFKIKDEGVELDRSEYDAFLKKRNTLRELLLNLRVAQYFQLHIKYARQEKTKKKDIRINSALAYYVKEFQDGILRVSFAVTDKIFLDMKRYCEQNNIRLVITNLPGGISFRSPEAVKESFKDILKDGDILRQLYINDSIKNICLKNKIEFIDLQDKFISAPDVDSLDFYKKGSGMECHYDESGHELVASELARYLRLSE